MIVSDNEYSQNNPDMWASWSSKSSTVTTADHRCIVHVDVDCFYCQCEHQDRNIPADRPMAIGQKQIVVTCNYAARDVGVTKLQSRTDAFIRCPNLLIVEGSDLERYRIHARKIYECFRRTCKEIHPDIAVCKGSMDEMMADFSVACKGDQTTADDIEFLQQVHIYGESGNEKTIVREDQPGAS